jgi:hypothetical protein
MSPPVVFIHGWKASILADSKTGKDEYNMTLPVLLGLAKDPALDLPLEWDNDDNQVKDNIIATEPISDVKCMCGTVKLADVYGPFIQHVEKTRDLHIFAYDWRRCLDETAASFEQFLVEVKTSTGQEPQVIAHSMGCLITLSVLNRRPEIFHSILFGAAAFSPNMSVLEDHSLPGNMNAMVKNSTMFSPKKHLCNPSSFFFLASSGERELWGKPTTVQIRDEESKPVSLDLHKVETFKKFKIGMYHPESEVGEIGKDLEEWFQAILDKCLAFRKSLLSANSKTASVNYPPVSVIRGDHTDTAFGYVLRGDGTIDLKTDKTHMRGDGRIVLEDAIPPSNVPVCKIVTSDKEHSEVLNDPDNIDMLLSLMISTKSNV